MVPVDRYYHFSQLLTLQDDLGILLKGLRTIGHDNFKLMVKHKSKEVGALINLLLSAFKNNSYYSVQFEDVEVLVGRARILLQATKDLSEKQELLDFGIELSLNYCRYPAMEIVGNMLNDFTDIEMRSMSTFFARNKESINRIKECFRVPIPEIIRPFLR